MKSPGKDNPISPHSSSPAGRLKKVLGDIPILGLTTQKKAKFFFKVYYTGHMRLGLITNPGYGSATSVN